MNKGRQKLIFAAVAVLLALLAVVGWRCLAGPDLPAEYAAVGRLPRIRPDYSEIVIPPNIAPLNFWLRSPPPSIACGFTGRPATTSWSARAMRAS